MRERLKSFLRICLPPFLFRIFNSNPSGPIYREVYSTWEEAARASTGYDQSSILAKTRDAALLVKRGEAVYERDSVLFDHIEYSLPVIIGLLLTAAKCGGSLSVLDFGGSLGSSYFQNRKFLDEFTRVNWGIVEQPHYIECGKALFQDEHLRFFNNIEECAAELKPNVVLLGSVLQYLRNPYQILNQLLNLNPEFLIIDKTPFSKFNSDMISVQHVPPSIYKASYPLWIFSRKVFDENMGEQWRLIEEFESIKDSIQIKNGINFNYQGMIFEHR